MYSLDSHELRAEGAEDSAVLVVLVGRKVWEHRSQRGQVLVVELVKQLVVVLDAVSTPQTQLDYQSYIHPSPPSLLDSHSPERQE